MPKPHEPAAPAPVADPAPSVVVATRPGTYPRPGDTYGIYRDTGSVFTLNDPAHYAPHDLGGWMKPWKQGDPIPTTEQPQIPQTAQRGQRMSAQIANPFPPMQ